MEIVRYTPELKEVWNEFLSNSRNGTFLLNRDYMEYHSDRFEDCSFIIKDEDRVIALLPADIRQDVVRSHGGLTYGGLILGYNTPGFSAMEMLQEIKQTLKNLGVKKLIYKPIPHIYHRYPCEEDLYALFRLDAKLSVRNMATVIDISQPIKSSRLGKRAVKRQRLGEITIHNVDCADSFWQIIVDDRRERHNTTPVHTLEEINRLHSLFPDKIRLIEARIGDDVVAGAVVYDDAGVLHLQYAAATHRGKDLYATDIIYHHLVFDDNRGARYFDFGTSNEDGGRYLNNGMVSHKEEFGGRSIVYDTYEITI
jgi:hypothetical protein